MSILPLESNQGGESYGWVDLPAGMGIGAGQVVEAVGASGAHGRKTTGSATMAEGGVVRQGSKSRWAGDAEDH